LFLWAKGPHPPYSPDLAPSDYRLFGPMKKMLGGQKFTSDTEVQSVVRQWLGQQPASFFASGIQKLVGTWHYGQIFERTWTICWKWNTNV